MFKLIVQTKLNGKTLKGNFSNRHEAKSQAGSLFHKDSVNSVCVAERADGKVVFYMNKNRPRNFWITKN
jgi:hypothetical protein